MPALPARALIAITFISIAKTPFAPRAAAQNAAGYRVDSSSANGLYIATFTTPQGLIKVNLPDDMAAGDTISGTVTPNQPARMKRSGRQNLAELNTLCDRSGRTTDAGRRQTFSWSIPQPLNTNSKHDCPFASRPERRLPPLFRYQPHAPPSPTQFTVPTGGQQGRLIQIDCPCNGVFSPQDYVRIGGKMLPLMAESPRSLVVHNTSEVLWANQYRTSSRMAWECSAHFVTFSINLSAAKLNLIRGETTTLKVVVLGLGGLPETSRWICRTLRQA